MKVRKLNCTGRSVTRTLVLALLAGLMVSACVSRTLVPLPDRGVPVPDGIIGVTSVSGEEIDLRDQDYDVQEAELVVRTGGTSGLEVQSIPRSEIQGLIVEEASGVEHVVGLILGATLAVGSGLLGVALSF